MINKIELNHEQNLFNYLSNKESNINPVEFWTDFCTWAAYYNDGSGEIISILEEITGICLSDESFDDEIDNIHNLISPTIFFNLSEKLQSEFLKTYNANDNNTRLVFELIGDNILSEETLLIHFTNNAEDILNEGFSKGVRDIGILAETVRLPDIFKMSNGYNFAYLADQKDFAIQNGSWSKNQALVFKSSGIHVRHFGDREEQVIFWGKNANLDNCVILNKIGNDWFIKNSNDALSINEAISEAKEIISDKKRLKIKKIKP